MRPDSGIMDQQLEYNGAHHCSAMPDCSVQFGGWRGDDCVMVTAQLRVTSKGSTVDAPLVEYQQASG